MSGIITTETRQKITDIMQSPDMRLHLKESAIKHRNMGLRNTKLTVEEVQAIKSGLRDGVPGATLAILYNVSPAAISRIKHGSRWQEVQ